MNEEYLPSPDMLNKLLRYDEATGKLFWKPRVKEFFSEGKNSAFNKWNTRWSGKEALFSVDSHGYFYGRIFGKRHSAHRVIMAMNTGVWPLEDVDHINGCRSDNRMINLRSVSRKENARNASKSKRNKSGYVGVSWSKKDKRWRAGICVDGKELYLGNFVNIEEAVAARCRANEKYGFSKNHGKAAMT